MSNFKPHTADTVDIEGQTFYTHHWVMARPANTPTPEGRDEGMHRHRVFYTQLVTGAIRQLVTNAFAHRMDTLKAAYLSGDTHFNTCASMERIDQLNDLVKHLCAKRMTQLCYAQTPPNTVVWAPSYTACIVKEALRLMIEEDN